MTRPAISFIVPVRDDAAHLERCLRSIGANDSSGTPIEIIVVDNSSTDSSPEVARRAGAQVLSSDARRVAELRNLAVAHASSDILAFVDADHEIGVAWVRAALATLRPPDVGAVGALCHAPADGTWVQLAYGSMRGVPTGVRDVEWLGSGNMALKRTTFDAVGGFDTTLTTCEDVDLCNNIRATGLRIVSHADMKNIHYGDPDTLWAVFKGELWRGRDNLRVSFRTGMTWRGLPSVLIPIVDLMMIAVTMLGIALAAAGSAFGFSAALCALCVITTVAALKVLRLAVSPVRGGLRHLLQVWVVACAYDVGRAIALIMRAPHRGTPVEMAPVQ